MPQIDKTLAEQLQINEREIAHRKLLLNFSDDDAKTLQLHKNIIDSGIDAIVNQFYDYQTSVPAISLLIGDAETLRRLKAAMRSYVLELFGGYYDMEYVNRRLRIGKIHERIGVSPKLYISAIYHLQTIINKAIEMFYFDSLQEESVQKLKESVNKIILFDVQLVFDTYIANLVSAVNSAKDELEHYAEGLEVEVAERTRQLEELARKDELTGLFNQRGLYEHLRREVAGVERYGETLSFVYFDMNDFKKLNDSQGHQAGDELLALVGSILSESLREIDIPCRYGGDEFCVIMPRTQLDDAKMVMKRFIEKFKNKNTSAVSFSIGISSTKCEGIIDMDSLVKAADSQMYKAKTLSKKKPGFHICLDKLI